MFDAPHKPANFLEWLRQQTSEHPRSEAKSATETFGVNHTGNHSTSTILGLYGLNRRDAIELVDRKIQRAIRAGTDILEIHFEEAPRLVRDLQECLSRSRAVTEFDVSPGRILVHLKPN